MCIDTTNKEAEQKEDRKIGREHNSHVPLALTGFTCDQPNCTFTASNRTGLVNHEHQKHGRQTIGQCNHCGKSFHIKGFPIRSVSVPRGTNGLA